MQEIYKLNAKPNIWEAFSTSSKTDTILSERHPEMHKTRRRHISKMFPEKNMGNVEQKILPHITQFVELLGERKISIQDLCDWLSFDVISDLLFSQRSDMLTSPAQRPIAEAYSSINLRCLIVRD